MRMNTLIVVLGPTGIGKSDISIQVANYFSTDIISADSRQFFRELSIGTAVPSEEDLKSVIHHFIHSRSIHDYYNVSEYETEAIDLINQLFRTKNPLILTGGSMLYIDTICKGIDDIPTVTPEIRQEVIGWYAENGLEALQQRLLNLDPEYHGIVDLNNPKRLLHAVEICQMTGKTFTSFRKNTVRERPFRIVKIGINQNREILYQRINERVERMMEAGLQDEARSVYPFKHLNSLNTVGYKELFAYFDGNCTLDEAVDLIKRNSRKYARKQLTWFRRDNEITWFEPEQIQEIIAFTEQKLKEHDR
ncbi:MAG: tRNA (adenosine(37)-N6)-dimethylallyltransferase MiaA [Bacteroidota bacterium]|nr:tRNA (adenosine(37)-N6)-dimethylallyltransferase MiaA [Bacteroidota bacterium]MDP3432308.1 tRNA (adenosine(37)-N6)-dimethylallyltransferase MiaA [Bacteroidota bacterium]